MHQTITYERELWDIGLAVNIYQPLWFICLLSIFTFLHRNVLLIHLHPLQQFLPYSQKLFPSVSAATSTSFRLHSNSTPAIIISSRLLVGQSARRVLVLFHRATFVGCWTSHSFEKKLHWGRLPFLCIIILLQFRSHLRLLLFCTACLNLQCVSS